MNKTIYRVAGGIRRTTRPRNAGKLTGAFDGMLARLGLASSRLKTARRKR
ncbi:MAG: hypothetical protein KatS3mg104_0035 [Phycisphaerae bacterium]|nr:MAG: hypothetical protein KatS3mg104_0035 [Phycisphaerae bacterium]